MNDHRTDKNDSNHEAADGAGSENAPIERSSTIIEASSQSASPNGEDQGSSKKIMLIGGGILVLLIFVYWIGSSNIDLPWKMGSKIGRAKNAISALVGGTIAYELAKQNNKPVVIDLDVEKGWWPDAEVKGTASLKAIAAKVNLWFTSATYDASTNAKGEIGGRVNKSEFDWKIETVGPNSYSVGRFGFKLDQTLELVVSQGKISGKIDVSLDRDYKIEGTYDRKSNAIDVTVKRNLSTVKFKLTGTITPQ
jgi:hypothetical protein